MTRRLLACLLLAASSSHADDPPGPAKPRPAATSVFGVRLGKTDRRLKRMTWEIAGVTREALVSIPTPTADGKPHPLIFIFHGHGGRMEFAAKKLPLFELWPEAVCVYPQGLRTPAPLVDPQGRMSGWQRNIGDQQDRDLKLFDAMLATVRSEQAIDPSRIYVCGHSNGGFFTYQLLAARRDLFAAAAPIAGFTIPKDFALQKPTPLLHVAGENDPIIRYRYQRETIEQVLKLNGCDPDGKPAGEFCTIYTSKTGPPLVTYIHPGGHEIPDGVSRRIVEFFQEHPKT